MSERDKLSDGDIKVFEEVLKRGECSICGQYLIWEFEDKKVQHQASCCGKIYSVEPYLVKISVFDIQ